ncbi:hypothetical protein N9P58_00070 [Puniceicoccaceae bacterium]|nr:hypothetical protein [Puniceicoccaceae bacterium]
MKLNILTVVVLLAGSLLSQAAEYGYLSFTATTTNGYEYDDETITLNAGDRIEFTATDFRSNIQLTMPDSSSINLDLGLLAGNTSNGTYTRAQIAGPCELQMFKSYVDSIGTVIYASYKITRAGTENSSSYITVPSNPSGNFELKLQTSTDLETWSSTTPGVFPYGDNAKFFRLVMETP